MVQDTIEKIEAKLTDNQGIKPENRAELVNLLRQLKSEINALAETNAECAQTVAGFTEVSTHEATPIHVLSLSAHGFAGNHPFARSHISHSRGHSATGPSFGSIPDPCGPFA